MSKKNKKIRGGGIVYSTDNDTMKSLFEHLSPAIETTKNSGPTSKEKTYDWQVRVWLDRKKRGGKEVTLIKGIQHNPDALKVLSKELKAACGVGGSVKDGEILLQGDQRDKVIPILLKKGYANTKKAGG